MRKDAECYRPTARMDKKIGDHVNDLFHATSLDRGQIIRLALVMLGTSEEGREILESHRSSGKTLPPPLIERYPEHGLWQHSMGEIVRGRGTSEEGRPVEKGGTSNGERRFGEGNGMARRVGEVARTEDREIQKGVVIHRDGRVVIR